MLLLIPFNFCVFKFFNNLLKNIWYFRDGCVAVFLFNNPRQKPLLLCHIDNCHHEGQVEVSAVEGIKTPNSLCVITGSHRSSQLSMWTWRFTDNEYEYLYKEMQNMNCSEFK